MDIQKRKYVGAYLGVKRMLDVILSALLLLILTLPMLIIGIWVASTSSGGAIFRQERIGRGERSFVCLKFRTMYRDAPSDVPSSEFKNAEVYVTSVGRFLRRTSLDELPQLINVLRGEMSLVGPRPLIPRESGIRELRRDAGVYELRPGITGLAQINGGERLCDREKVELDRKYRESVSFFTDLKIVALTPARALRRDRNESDGELRERKNI